MGTAILYISHDLLSVATLCHRIAILRAGQIVECDTPEVIIDSPSQDYTRKLIKALPSYPQGRISHESAQLPKQPAWHKFAVLGGLRFRESLGST